MSHHERARFERELNEFIQSHRTELTPLAIAHALDAARQRIIVDEVKRLLRSANSKAIAATFTRRWDEELPRLTSMLLADGTELTIDHAALGRPENAALARADMITVELVPAHTHWDDETYVQSDDDPESDRYLYTLNLV